MNPGEWFMIPLGRPWPNLITVFTGSVLKRVPVRKITKQQALALWRWHGERVLYFSYKDGNGRWIDVHVCGDVDAWFGDPDEDKQGKF